MRGDEGVALVWALALVSVVLLAGLLSVGVGVRALERARASTVADVAALAAAQSPDDPCGAAARAAGGNDMAVQTCSVQGEDVIVTVEAPTGPVVARLLAFLGQPPGPVTATSRAGPPDE